MVPFLSVVMVVHNRAKDLRYFVSDWVDAAVREGTMCEVIIVDNASTDGTTEQLEALVQELPDLQVFVLSEHVDELTAERAGLEAAIGDTIISVDRHQRVRRELSRGQLTGMLQAPRQPWLVRLAWWLCGSSQCYHISREFGSPVKTRRQGLNVEQAL